MQPDSGPLGAGLLSLSLSLCTIIINILNTSLWGKSRIKTALPESFFCTFYATPGQFWSFLHKIKKAQPFQESDRCQKLGPAKKKNKKKNRTTFMFCRAPSTEPLHTAMFPTILVHLAPKFTMTLPLPKKRVN